jgi:hypothetical protein
MPYKNFTPSELLSADVNTYLMNQSVMTFDNASARSSALTLPVEGMMSYLKDSDTLWIYNGSAWIELARSSRSGLTKVTATSVVNATINTDASISYTNQSTFSVNGCFTSTYRNYRVIIITTAVSTNNNLLFRLRRSGTDSVTGYYWGANFVLATGSMSYSNGNNATSLNHAFGGTTFEEVGQVVLDICNPQQASLQTTATFTDVRHDSAATVSRTGGLLHSVATDYDGFTYSCSAGTISGLAYVYGYN